MQPRWPRADVREPRAGFLRSNERPLATATRIIFRYDRPPMDAADGSADDSFSPMHAAGAADRFVAAAGTPARRLHSRITVKRYYEMHLLGATFLLTAALALYGWRAILTISLVVAAAGTSVLIWREIGSRGRDLSLAYALWLGILLALMLPPHFATGVPGPGGHAVWPIPVAAGMLLVILMWLMTGSGLGRLHPAVIAFLLLTALFQDQMLPHWILQALRMPASAMSCACPAGETADPARFESWLRRPAVPGWDAPLA